MIRKLRYSIYSLCIGSCLAHTTLTANLLDDYLNEESLADAFDQHFFDSLDSDFFELLPTKALTPADIIGFLLSLNALQILESDFFLRTNPLNKRSLLDSPLFEYRSFDEVDVWHVWANVFYNKTDRYNFTAKSDRICSYLALSSPSLIGAIVSIIENINAISPNFFDLDVPTVFGILQHIHIEERNLGGMISTIYQWKRGYIQGMVPIFYHERNFFLIPNQLDALADQLGESEPDFQKNHAICDKVGLGDTRLEMGINVIEKPSLEAIVGLQFTIPTAFTIAKNFFGTHFDKAKFQSYPNVDFNLIYQALEDYLEGTITLREQLAVINVVRRFILGAMDRLAANLIDDPMGNGGHFGSGIFFRTQSPLSSFCSASWISKWWWNNRMSLEYLWPKSEWRFYINENNRQNFLNRDFTDPDQAADNLIFIQDELINRVYLLALAANVQPGLIFRWTSAFNYVNGGVYGDIGANLWVQQIEKLSNKRVSSCSPTTTAQILALDDCKVHVPVALQLKLFGDISYTFKERDFEWTIGVNGDITAVKYGIGRDYTLGLFLEGSF